MKVKLLCLFLEISLDPLAPPDKAKGCAIYRRTVPEHGSLIKESTIQLDNHEIVRQNDFPLDTTHSQLAIGKL